MNDEEIASLLPWYVNGTLSEAERSEVEALLARSNRARNELEFFRELSKQVKEEPVEKVSELGWRRLQRDIQKLNRDPGSGWWKRGLAVAATLIVALQVGILAQRQDTRVDTRLLGQGAVTSQLQGTHWRLQIEFREESDWREISDLIYGLQGTIIDGPSAIGLLHVAIPKNSGEYTSSESLLSWLRQQPQVIHAAVEGD
jgi:hypothetical protein